jgi:hypothetical protein
MLVFQHKETKKEKRKREKREKKVHQNVEFVKKITLFLFLTNNKFTILEVVFYTIV